MSTNLEFADYRRMANLLYQSHHGHIVVNAEGRPWLLDTGAPFSVGHEPVRIAGRAFPVESCYMGISGSYLTEHVGVPIEGMIGADILQHFNLGIYSNEGMVQFSQQRPAGEIVVPLQEHRGIPIVSLRIGDRVRRLFLDTGSSLSYLTSDCLTGHEPEGRYENFYPLLGEFLTDVYGLEIAFGGLRCTLRFGELPDELSPMLESAGVEGILGTELLRYFAVSLSLRERILCLESQYTAFGLAAG